MSSSCTRTHEDQAVIIKLTQNQDHLTQLSLTYHNVQDRVQDRVNNQNQLSGSGGTRGSEATEVLLVSTETKGPLNTQGLTPGCHLGFIKTRPGSLTQDQTRTQVQTQVQTQTQTQVLSTI